MSIGAYDNINGTSCKVTKMQDNINGTACKVLSGYDNISGTACKYFSDAVQWTFNGTESITWGASYGASNTGYSAYLAVGGGSGGTGTLTEVYTFSEPITMKAGQTLTISTMHASSGTATSTVLVNGNQVYTKSNSAATTITETYTFTSDTVINSITATIYDQTSSGTTIDTGAVTVTVNSDIGSFQLNDSGTSENQ